MNPLRAPFSATLAAALANPAKDIMLLNVSHAPTRELRADFNQALGGWQAASKTHFQDGGSFDQIHAKR